MGGPGGCQFSSQFSVNGWLILVQTPCERKLYARGPLPPPLFQSDCLKQDCPKTTSSNYCMSNCRRCKCTYCVWAPTTPLAAKPSMTETRLSKHKIRTLLERPLCASLEIPCSYGRRNFVTILISASHWSRF